jgi:hypothetical protein
MSAIGMLNSNNEKNRAEEAQMIQDKNNRILASKQKNPLQNQTISKNYGNIDIDALVNGVFTKPKQSGMDWSTLR